MSFNDLFDFIEFGKAFYYIFNNRVEYFRITQENQYEVMYYVEGVNAFPTCELAKSCIPFSRDEKIIALFLESRGYKFSTTSAYDQIVYDEYDKKWVSVKNKDIFLSNIQFETWRHGEEVADFMNSLCLERNSIPGIIRLKNMKYEI